MSSSSRNKKSLKSVTTKRRRNFKVGDIVLVSSVAGDCIPKIHVKLLKRVERKGQPSKLVGYKQTMEWPAYSGWEATPIYQKEIDNLKKRWCIPLKEPGKDITFVYDECIVKKVKTNVEKREQSHKNSKINNRTKKNGNKTN